MFMEPGISLIDFSINFFTRTEQMFKKSLGSFENHIYYFVCSQDSLKFHEYVTFPIFNVFCTVYDLSLIHI